MSQRIWTELQCQSRTTRNSVAIVNSTFEASCFSRQRLVSMSLAKGHDRAHFMLGSEWWTDGPSDSRIPYMYIYVYIYIRCDLTSRGSLQQPSSQKATRQTPMRILRSRGQRGLFEATGGLTDWPNSQTPTSESPEVSRPSGDIIRCPST